MFEKNTLGFCLWDKTFLLDAASNRGRPLFGGGLYSSKEYRP